MRNHSRRYIHAVAIFALAALPALAKPNFTGDWKLNSSKSDFGQMPAPDSMSMQVSHDEPKLKAAIKMSGSMGDLDHEVSYTTDGKECTNDVHGPVKSTLKWDGETLIIDSKGTFEGSDYTMLDKWKLSEDGKTLSIDRHFSGDMGENDQKLVFDKQ